ncbi:hypothetical protein CISIN_1g035194mg [Citrus sinensis]|uniref:BED-type domain-containing protein n=1 Tax=Citrus sinensis TaxID=2711 RepID=A0A067DB55_CITSI|nr:hypothetical protein CISIN_1g035194mg [Citrus sinensis]
MMAITLKVIQPLVLYMVCCDVEEGLGQSCRSILRKKNNGIDKVVCIYCNNALVARSTDGTKHLHDHLKRC